MGYTYLGDEIAYGISVLFPKLSLSILRISLILLFVYKKVEARTVGAKAQGQAQQLQLHPPLHQRAASPAQFPWRPMRASRHAGDLPMCVLTESLLWVWCTTWRSCHNPRKMRRHIDLSESSPARASRLISKQVRMNESNSAACHTVLSPEFLGYHVHLNKLPPGISRRQTPFCLKIL